MAKKYDRELTTEELKKMSDKEINFSDIPELDEEFWADAELKNPENKQPITVRFDADMLDWFKSQGRGYQTRMNTILRSYYEAHKDKR